MPDDTPKSAASPQRAPEPESLHIAEELEELERPRGVLSPIGIVAIGAVILFGVLGLLSYLGRPQIVLTGAIEDVTAIATAPEQTLIAAKINLQNGGGKTVTLRDVKLKVVTPAGEIVAQRLPGSEYQRIYRDYPELRERSTTPMAVGSTVDGGMQERGSVIFAVPANYDAVTTRQAIRVEIETAEAPPFTLTK